MYIPIENTGRGIDEPSNPQELLGTALELGIFYDEIQEILTFRLQ